jgi:hypothetical protein
LSPHGGTLSVWFGCYFSPLRCLCVKNCVKESWFGGLWLDVRIAQKYVSQSKTAGRGRSLRPRGLQCLGDGSASQRSGNRTLSRRWPLTLTNARYLGDGQVDVTIRRAVLRERASRSRQSSCLWRKGKLVRWTANESRPYDHSRRQHFFRCHGWGSSVHRYTRAGADPARLYRGR